MLTLKENFIIEIANYCPMCNGFITGFKNKSRLDVISLFEHDLKSCCCCFRIIFSKIVLLLVRPQITAKLKNNIANEMDNVSFHCAASGKPEPTITWTRNGQMVGNGEYLNFTAQTNLDGSVYKCTAENGVGQPASATATLTVKGLGMIIHLLSTDRCIVKKNTGSKTRRSTLFSLIFSTQFCNREN